MADAFGRPKSIAVKDKNIMIVFLPPNTTALLQVLAFASK